MAGKFLEKSLAGKMLEVIVLLGAIFFGQYFQWEVVNLVFFVLFIFFIFHPIPSRFAVYGALLFLSLAAILPIFKQNSWAENCFIWAYYLMIFTAAMAFFELHDEKDGAIIDKD